MAGIFFEYFDGYIRVEFSRAWYGDIYIDFHLHGDAIASIPCDDNFVKGKPEISMGDDVSVRVWTSSSVSWFFTNLVSWLEAITCGVAECAFCWDGEGPDGEMRWHRGSRGSGNLQISWTGSDRLESPPFEYRIRLNKVQMVRTLYETFRSYVESDRYDRLDYEEVTAGEAFALVLEGGDLDALAQAFVERDRGEAWRLLRAMLNLAGDRDLGYPRRASLATFIERAASPEYRFDDEDAKDVEEWINEWFDPQWEAWNAEQRQKYIVETVYNGGPMLAFGERASELRSTLIENWLEKHPAECPSPQGGSVSIKGSA